MPKSPTPRLCTPPSLDDAVQVIESLLQRLAPSPGPAPPVLQEARDLLQRHADTVRPGDQIIGARAECKHPEHTLQVTRISEGIVFAAPVGGGFALKIPVADALTKFRRIVNPGAARAWRKSLFAVEDDPTYEGWHTGAVWNGWAMPYFDLEVAVQIIKACKPEDLPEDQPLFGYDSGGSTLTAYPGTKAAESWSGQTIQTPDGPLLVFGVGAGSWIWDECPPGTRTPDPRIPRPHPPDPGPPAPEA